MKATLDELTMTIVSQAITITRLQAENEQLRALIPPPEPSDDD